MKYLFSQFCRAKFYLNDEKKKRKKFCKIFSDIMFKTEKDSKESKSKKKLGLKICSLFLEKYEIMFNNSMTNIKFDNTEKIYSRKEGDSFLSSDFSSHVVTQGNTEQILFKMMDKYYVDIIDPDFIPMLISTHHYFISHVQFLSWIFEKYLLLLQGKKEWHTSTRLGLLITLKDWIQDVARTNSIEETFDKEFLITWKMFVPKISEDQSASVIVNFLVNLDFNNITPEIKKQELKKGTGASLRKIIVSRQSMRKKNSDVEDISKISHKDIVNCITHECSRLFREIKPTELLFSNWEDPKKSKNFAALVEIFNRYQGWAATQIMIRDKMALRVEAYEKIVRIAHVKKNYFILFYFYFYF